MLFAALVRDVYATKFGDAVAPAVQAKLPERERETLTRALRTRPPGSDPLTSGLLVPWPTSSVVVCQRSLGVRQTKAE